MVKSLIQIFQKSKIKARLYFILILLFIPLFFLFALTILTQNRAINFGAKEISGLNYNSKVIRVIGNLQKLSFLVNSENFRKNFDKNKFAEMETNQKAIFSELKKEHTEFIEQLFSDSDNQLFLTSEKIKILQTQNEDLHTSLQGTDYTLIVKNIDQILLSLFDLNTYIGDSSNLILDPDLDSFYLMDITLIKLPTLIQKINELDNLLFKILEAGKFESELTIKVFCKTSELNSTLEQTQISFQAAYKYNKDLKTKLNSQIVSDWKYFEAMQSFSTSISNPNILNKQLPSLENIQALSSASQNSIQEIYKLAAYQQKNLLEKRISGFRAEQITYSLIIIILLASVVFLQVLIIKSITDPLHETSEKFSLLAKGNLNQRIDYKGTDEIGTLSSSINFFIEYLSNLIRIINKQHQESNQLFEQIAQMTAQLTESTHNQSSSTEESAAALEEISASFMKIARSISQESNDIIEIGSIAENISLSIGKTSESIFDLTILANKSRKEAGKGEGIISNTVESMIEIKKVADEISKIIILITEISKQTSLLSLNASIEAARAGEHGKGFSIVADEVSKLAFKTEDSVKQIRGLIISTNDSVKVGTTNVNSVVAVLKNVITFINQINEKAQIVEKEIGSQSVNVNFISRSHQQLQEISNQIDSSAKEEQIAISQISESMNHISNETHEIATNLSSLIEYAEKMKYISGELNSTLAKFKI
jgi:methyl-accepting chemotaxis protein